MVVKNYLHSFNVILNNATAEVTSTGLRNFLLSLFQRLVEVDKNTRELIVLSALPNSLISGHGMRVIVSPLTEDEVRTELSTRTFLSGVGHQTTAELFSNKLGINLAHNRKLIKPDRSLEIIVGLFTPPRRLQEGEKWSESEILSMPINWTRVVYT